MEAAEDRRDCQGVKRCHGGSGVFEWTLLGGQAALVFF